MDSQVLLPVLLGGTFAALVLASLPKEPVLYDPAKSEFSDLFEGNKEEEPKKPHDVNVMPKPTSMKAIEKSN